MCSWIRIFSTKKSSFKTVTFSGKKKKKKFPFYFSPKISVFLFSWAEKKKRKLGPINRNKGFFPELKKKKFSFCDTSTTISERVFPCAPDANEHPDTTTTSSENEHPRANSADVESHKTQQPAHVPQEQPVKKEEQHEPHQRLSEREQQKQSRQAEAGACLVVARRCSQTPDCGCGLCACTSHVS